MTTLASVRVRCRNCRTSSEHTVLQSTNTFGSRDLDLRPPEMQRSTMDTWLQLCPHCGYCAPDISGGTANAAVLRSDEYRAALEAADFPGLARRFLAFAIAIGHTDAAAAAFAFLRAAWVCDDAGQPDQAVESRRQAARWFRRCKPFAEDEGGITVGAVLVDVLRRSGQFAEASEECTALFALQKSSTTLRKVLECQLRLIARQDTSAHTVADCQQDELPQK